jgi:hypothetical protein
VVLDVFAEVVHRFLVVKDEPEKFHTIGNVVV